MCKNCSSSWANRCSSKTDSRMPEGVISVPCRRRQAEPDSFAGRDHVGFSAVLAHPVRWLHSPRQPHVQRVTAARVAELLPGVHGLKHACAREVWAASAPSASSQRWQRTGLRACWTETPSSTQQARGPMMTMTLIIDSDSVWWTRARKSKRPARKRRCTRTDHKFQQSESLLHM